MEFEGEEYINSFSVRNQLPWMYILSVGVAKFTCTDGIRWGLCVKYVERKYLNGNILTMPQVIIKLAPFFEPDRPISLFVRR